MGTKLKWQSQNNAASHGGHTKASKTFQITIIRDLRNDIFLSYFAWLDIWHCSIEASNFYKVKYWFSKVVESTQKHELRYVSSAKEYNNRNAEENTQFMKKMNSI